MALGGPSQPDPAERRQLFQIIDGQADLLRGLINDLLDMTQVESGSLSFTSEPVDVTALVDHARTTFMRGGAANSIEVDLPRARDANHLHHSRVADRSEVRGAAHLSGGVRGRERAHSRAFEGDLLLPRDDTPQPYRLGDLTIDYDERAVTVAGRPVQLTPTEYKLLCELSINAGRVVEHRQLLDRVWGSEYSGDTRIVRVFVKDIRKKLGDDARNPTYIFTLSRVGYRMARPT